MVGRHWLSCGLDLRLKAFYIRRQHLGFLEGPRAFVIVMYICIVV